MVNTVYSKSNGVTNNISTSKSSAVKIPRTTGEDKFQSGLEDQHDKSSSFSPALKNCQNSILQSPLKSLNALHVNSLKEAGVHQERKIIGSLVKRRHSSPDDNSRPQIDPKKYSTSRRNEKDQNSKTIGSASSGSLFLSPEMIRVEKLSDEVDRIFTKCHKEYLSPILFESDTEVSKMEEIHQLCDLEVSRFHNNNEEVIQNDIERLQNELRRVQNDIGILQNDTRDISVSDTSEKSRNVTSEKSRNVTSEKFLSLFTVGELLLLQNSRKISETEIILYTRQKERLNSLATDTMDTGTFISYTLSVLEDFINYWHHKVCVIPPWSSTLATVINYLAERRSVIACSYLETRYNSARRRPLSKIREQFIEIFCTIGRGMVEILDDVRYILSVGNVSEVHSMIGKMEIFWKKIEHEYKNLCDEFCNICEDYPNFYEVCVSIGEHYANAKDIFFAFQQNTIDLFKNL